MLNQRLKIVAPAEEVFSSIVSHSHGRFGPLLDECLAEKVPRTIDLLIHCAGSQSTQEEAAKTESGCRDFRVASLSQRDVPTPRKKHRRT